MPRPPEYRPYRVAVYLIFGAFSALLGFQLIRSVTADLFGRAPRRDQPATAAACLDDLERLYASLSPGAVQPAPGAESPALDRDGWARRWEDDVAGVRERCNLEAPADAAHLSLAEALDGLEDLRRNQADSGGQARRVRDSLAAARRSLGLR